MTKTQLEGMGLADMLWIVQQVMGLVPCRKLACLLEASLFLAGVEQQPVIQCMTRHQGMVCRQGFWPQWFEYVS